MEPGTEQSGHVAYDDMPEIISCNLVYTLVILPGISSCKAMVILPDGTEMPIGIQNVAGIDPVSVPAMVNSLGICGSAMTNHHVHIQGVQPIGYFLAAPPMTIIELRYEAHDYIPVGTYRAASKFAKSGHTGLKFRVDVGEVAGHSESMMPSTFIPAQAAPSAQVAPS